jgi:cob(I)alamin adenosyltransferase
VNRRLQSLALFGTHDAANTIIDLRLFYGKSASPAEMLLEMDKMLIYLCRYGRLTPEYVESLDVDHQARLVEVTDEWIAAENGNRKTKDFAHDPGADFR